MKKYLKNMAQLILSPANGWEDIAAEQERPDEVARRGFFPLAALVGVSVLVSALYSRHVEAFHLVLQALITGMSYFLSYFMGTFALSLFVEPLLEGRYDERRCQIFTLYIVGILAAIKIVINCLPVSYVMLFFVPLYVVLIEWKGATYLNVKPSRVGVFMILAVFGVLVPPFLIDFLFSQLI